MHNTQEEITNDMCKTHTGRIERDFYRICPSKLSKRELEDMYFALVENNMELKKTVNGQREQIKLLNTKVQRMMAQRPTNTRELKECCINNKAIINEQKEVIADLKKSNDRLTERIRLLNMRLCSAKQFLKKGQLPSSARCPKCSNGVLASVKNLSTTGLNIEPSVRSANASCQYLASETSPVRSLIPGNTTREQEVASRSPDKLCDQNKCHTVMEELKQKSIALQQELSQTHEEYASRITRLEEEMAQLTRENVRVRNESTSSERHLEEQRGEISDLLQRLRKCEAQCEHLSVQLKIEKSRSAELEMRVKAADMSSAIATAVEQHLANLNLQKIEQEKRIEPDPLSHSITDENSSMYHCQFQLIVPNNSISSQTDKGSQSSSEKIINRTSDDSGYTDTNRSDCSSEVSPTKNDKVMTKIADLHEQLKHLKQSLVENCGKSNENCIQRRKSCFGRPSCSTNNENSNNLPVPGDPDYLISTNRLNSYKNTNDWCQDFDKSDAGSSICENNHSIVSTTKDIERSNSINEKDPKNDQEYEEGTFFHKKYVDDNADEASCINISKVDLTDINEPTEGNKTYRKEETDNNEVNKNKIVKPNDSFNFTKEKITKIDGKLISETLHEMDRKNTSTIDLKVDDSFQKHGNESNTNLTDSVSNIITKNVATTSKNIVDSKEIINRKFVSTGVDPIDFSPNEKFKDACVLADVNPLPLLEKNRLDICEQSVRVCTCPESSRRAMSTFRSCSGTLRFTTTPSNSKFRKCGCADNRLPTTPAFKGGEDIRKTTPTHGTYVIHGEAIVDRSPDTTREISSLTDLPSEKEVLSTQTSPGEDKSTGTLSDETPHTTTDYGSLSEGELPFSGRKRQSIDETPILDDRNLRRRETSTSEKMEETLRAISEELSRCRQLLQIHSSHESTKSTFQDACSMTQTKPPISKLNTETKQTDRENPCLAYRNNRLSCPNNGPDCRNNVPDDRNTGLDNRNNDLDNGKTDLANLNSGFNDRNLVLDKLSFGMNNSNPGFDIRKSGLTLRQCDANERLGGVSAKCILTLHVGTVILSDQAVITSRGKSLALTWRFYDQSPTMTHQLAGRVMHFDFSLEYDIRLSQNLLDYLKHEEMPIIVCEIDKQEKPFAICLLPLRDALLHINKRVDMSLALIAGTSVKRKDASVNSFTINEELGVLDVWCMLRVPPSMMSVINDVISQTIASFHHHPSSMERIVDDDHSDFHLNQDLNLRRTSKRQLSEAKYSYDSDNIYGIMNSNKWRGSSSLKLTDGSKKKSASILQKDKLSDDNNSLDITILWLALNEECRAMNDARVKRLYVAFKFLGKAGADMETPNSLPKPRNFMDKCHFNFRKSFAINEGDMAVVGQMAQRRQDNTTSLDPKDCIIFSIISEPPEDPLGLESCEDIGCAYLFLGDALSSNGNSYTEVLPIRTLDEALVCGRLAIRVDGLSVLRACIQRTRYSSSK